MRDRGGLKPLDELGTVEPNSLAQFVSKCMGLLHDVTLDILIIASQIDVAAGKRVTSQLG